MSGKKSRTLLKRRTRRPNKSLTPKDGRLFKRVSFFHVCCNRICYHAIRRCPYLSFMQAGLLLKPSYVFFRSVPELHQTQDSTDLPSELLRERGLTSCGACRPTPGHGTGTRLKASAVPLCPAIYTSNLLPTIYIAVYTYRCIYSYTDIRLHTLHLRCLFYIHLYLSFHFRFWFRPHFSFACCHPSTFILQRYRRQGTRQTPECFLLAENFS